MNACISAASRKFQSGDYNVPKFFVTKFNDMFPQASDKEKLSLARVVCDGMCKGKKVYIEDSDIYTGSKYVAGRAILFRRDSGELSSVFIEHDDAAAFFKAVNESGMNEDEHRAFDQLLKKIHCTEENFYKFISNERKKSKK